MTVFFGADLGDHYSYLRETEKWKPPHIEVNLAGDPRYFTGESFKHFKKYYCYSGS